MPDQLAGLMALDADGLGPFLAPVVGPAQVARQHVFGALEPLEADDGSSGRFRMTRRYSGSGEDVDLFARGSGLLFLDAGQGRLALSRV